MAVWLYDYCRWGCLSLPATDCVRLFGCTTAAVGVVCRFLPPIASGRLAVRLLPVGLSVTGRLAVRLLPLGLSVASCHRLRLAVWLYDYCRWGCLSLPATDYVWPFGCTTAAGGVVCHWPFGCTTTAVGVVCRFLPPIASGRLAVRLLPVGLSVASCH